MATETIAIRVTAARRRELEALARQEERSLGDLTRELVVEGIVRRRDRERAEASR